MEITVKNVAGGATTPPVTVTVHLPKNIELDPGSPGCPGGRWTASLPDAYEHSVSCPGGNIAPASSLRLVLRVSGSGAGIESGATSTVTVSSTGSGPGLGDADQENNIGSFAITVN